jgi:putative membrane protein
MQQKTITVALATIGFAAGATLVGSAQSADGPSAQDRNFVQTVQVGDDTEIADARYMLGRTKNAQIRAFANELISDHSSANVALLKAARNAHVPVPQGMRRSDIATAPDPLRTLSGKQLTSAYLSMEIDGHEKMLALLKTEESSGSDPALKSFASLQEPIVKKHLDNAHNIADLGTMATPTPPALGAGGVPPIGQGSAAPAVETTPGNGATSAPSSPASPGPGPSASASPASAPSHSP